ncbi:CamS family sex pheromone protein [Bacillus sp. FJAT-45037]|uniref:CamS family sex pheromone protein n=1 Tax=Bacillus sp. FJAT-45037 TaxID=2011007 RepID=UPI000C23BCF3|nr:CamS family sex pheromone protein [Bacillus sp. FJAT-45037]
MNVNRWGIVTAVSLLFLTGCFPMFQQPEEEETVVEEPQQEEQNVDIVPQVSTPENYYQSVLYDGAYLHGNSRGFGNAVVYNRLDLDQLEMGLTQIAKETFDPENYFFREGQFISRSEINEWLMRYDEESNRFGINPALGEGETMREREDSQPRYLSHILEHNYLVQNENGNYELGGIVIGLSMNSVYNFRVEDDQGRYTFYETNISQEVMERQGQEMAAEIVERLRVTTREDGVFNQIPITVALFREQPQQSTIPGNFIMKSTAPPGEGLERWQRLNERYYLFPSSAANEDVNNDAAQFQQVKDDLQSFFDTFVGVVGRGYYVDNQLQEMTIEVPLRYQGKAEIVALTQYAADVIQQRMTNQNVKVNLYVTSVAGKHESLVVKNPGEEPFIHVFE